MRFIVTSATTHEAVTLFLDILGPHRLQFMEIPAQESPSFAPQVYPRGRKLDAGRFTCSPAMGPWGAPGDQTRLDHISEKHKVHSRAHLPLAHGSPFPLEIKFASFPRDGERRGCDQAKSNSAKPIIISRVTRIMFSVDI